MDVKHHVYVLTFIWCFSRFNYFRYCRGNCICAGQGNTIVSLFVVQRADLIVAVACFPCGPRRSLIYAWEWGVWVCWKLSAAVRIKPDCRLRLLWSQILTNSSACVLSFYHSTPLQNSEQWTIQITTTRKTQPNNNNNNKNITSSNNKKHLQAFTFFPFLPITKTRTINIQAHKFNKHSYTKDSPEHDFICQSGSYAGLPWSHAQT